MTRRITIYCDEELARQIEDRARLEGISRNQVILRLIRRGMKLAELPKRTGVVGQSLDWFIGSWTEEEAREFDEAVSGFGRIDPDMWT